MLCGVLGRDDGHVGVAVLNRLAREVLHQSLLVEEVVQRGDDLGCRESHHRGDALEAARDEFICRLDEIGVGEFDALAAGLELEEKVVLLDFLAEAGAGEALAVPAHEKGGVDAGEHGGLASGGLG